MGRGVLRTPYEMGTGKSKVAIDTMGALYEAGKIQAALIVAPKGVYDNWVKGEIPLHLPDRIPRQILRWTPTKTQRYENELKDFIVNREPLLKVFVMNIEAFSSDAAQRQRLPFCIKTPTILSSLMNQLQLRTGRLRGQRISLPCRNGLNIAGC